MALFTATEAPAKPERSPESSAASGAKTNWSQRCCMPTETPMPSVAHGDFQPYLPRSPVTSASQMFSAVDPCEVPGSSRDATWAAVTPPVVKMFQGTQVGEPLLQTGLA